MYAWIESTHVLTLILFLGMLFIIDLRMLGVAFADVPASTRMCRLLTTSTVPATKWAKPVATDASVLAAPSPLSGTLEPGLNSFNCSSFGTFARSSALS